jgi:hypothetical protein
MPLSRPQSSLSALPLFPSILSAATIRSRLKYSLGPLCRCRQFFEDRNRVLEIEAGPAFDGLQNAEAVSLFEGDGIGAEVSVEPFVATHTPAEALTVGLIAPGWFVPVNT